MARNIKGITIEIGGNTTKLQDALKGVNKVIYSTNSELKNLNQALKLDPKNTELLAQKQDVLKRNIEATTQKLNQLKSAQQAMGNYSKLTEEQKESYRTLSIEIAKSESALKSMNNELKGMNTIDLSKVQGSLKSIGNVAIGVGKGIATAVGAATAAIGAVVAQGVKSYAELEQNIGGVETLFGGDADKVIKNASEAFRTAGVSANEYMQGVTSFAASLLQSVAGNTAEAANVADMAFRDMSDNANKFGTDMQSIQNAYQGFAKQNYTMLDNLKLGYGGTKTEMERLLKDAEKLTGVKYDISNLSDVYNAIHVIQEELGVAGTTALEAETTITGSAASMKAAFDNFLNGSGSPEQLAESFTTFFGNISNAIEKLLPSITKGLAVLAKDLAPKIVKMVVDLLPVLIQAGQDLIKAFLDFIANDTETLVNTAVDLMTNLVTFILDNLPLLLEASMQIMVQLAEGIAKNLPVLIPKIVEVVLKMVDTLVKNIPLLINAALQLMIGLAQGLILAIPELIKMIPQIIFSLVEALCSPESIMMLINAAIELIFALLQGFVDNFFNIIDWIKEVPKKIKDALLGKNGDMKDAGKDLMNGLWEGIKNTWNNLKGKVEELGSGIVKKFKNVFGIHSPSTVMRDEIGLNLGLGLVEGIEDTQKQVNAAMLDLSSGINASVNPTINPTANSNPLIIQIENFNNQRESDIEQLAQELEFYRKNSALAKGGI